jgi:hypothetical protein
MRSRPAWAVEREKKKAMGVCSSSRDWHSNAQGQPGPKVSKTPISISKLVMVVHAYDPCHVETWVGRSRSVAARTKT